MDNLPEILTTEVPEGMQPSNSCPQKRTPIKLSRKHLILGALCLCAVLLCLNVFFVLDTLKTGTNAAIDSFVTAKDESAEAVYQAFYDASYTAAERVHHVSNNISITIGDLQEEQRLEVLKVSEVTYETTPEKNREAVLKNIFGAFDKEATSWLEVPGSGVFTVNLQASEFIIDEERQYVLIRVPSPELTQFSIDYANVEVLLFEKGGAFKNSGKYGKDLAIEQLQSAELTIRQKLINNQNIYGRAKDSATNMLVTLVKQLNPKLPNLKVEVEFIG